MVSDPIGSRFTYSEKEFMNCWQNKDGLGVVFCMKPNQKFFDSNNHEQRRLVIIHCLSSIVTMFSGVRLATSMYANPVKQEKMKMSLTSSKR